MIKQLLIAFILLVAVSAHGATIYLDVDATEAGCTGAYDNPCKELDHIEDGGHSSGDKVLLECGDTWSKSAGDWGAVGDRINLENGETNLTIGAYYLYGATPRQVDGVTYKCTDAAAGPSVKPIIDGNVSSGWGTSTYDSIIQAEGGVTGLVIQDIEFNNYYRGILIKQPVANSSSAISDVIIQRCEFDNFGLSWIFIEPYVSGGVYSYDNISDITIQDNTAVKGMRQFRADAAGWGNCVSILLADSVVVRRNIFGQCNGEGVLFGREADDGEMYHNILWDVDGGALKSVTSDNVTIRHNYAIHTGDAEYRNRTAAGLVMSSEGDLGDGITDSSNCHYYGNVIIGCSVGLWMDDGTDDADEGSATNYVYNNTFIDNTVTYRLQTGGGNFEFTVEVQNNLSVLNHPSDTAHYAFGTIAPGIHMNGNGWDESEAVDTDYCTSANCNDGTDVTGDPALVEPEPCTDDWRGCAAYNTPSWGDAALSASSDFIDVGAALADSPPGYLALNPNSEWVDDVNTLNQDTYTPWEMGAYVYGEAIPVAPTYPLQGVAGNFKYN